MRNQPPTFLASSSPLLPCRHVSWLDWLGQQHYQSGPLTNHKRLHMKIESPPCWRWLQKSGLLLHPTLGKVQRVQPRDEGLVNSSAHTFETGFTILIPERQCSIRSGGAEGTMRFMEWNVVHRKYVGVSFIRFFFAVAFEGEIIATKVNK